MLLCDLDLNAYAGEDMVIDTITYRSPLRKVNYYSYFYLSHLGNLLHWLHIPKFKYRFLKIDEGIIVNFVHC